MPETPSSRSSRRQSVELTSEQSEDVVRKRADRNNFEQARVNLIRSIEVRKQVHGEGDAVVARKTLELKRVELEIQKLGTNEAPAAGLAANLPPEAI